MKKLFLALGLVLLSSIVNASPFAWVVQTYDLAATSYTYCTTDPIGSAPVCGTAATDGWLTMVSGNRPIVAAVDWVTKAANSLEYSLQCRPYTSGSPLEVQAGTLSAAGPAYIVILANANAFDQCRIGLKITTDSGTNSVTAYFAVR